MTDTNPLYQPADVPAFAAIRPEHAAIIPQILDENRAAIEALIARGDFTWDGLMQPLERLENRLAKAVSPVAHLHAVTSTDEWRAAYEALLPALTAYGSDLGQHEGLYRAIKSLRDSDDYDALSGAQRKVIDDALKNFERSGVALDAAAKARYKEISLRLAELGTQFANHVLDATNAWHLHLPDASRLAGIPDSARALMADLARQHGEDGYRITLDAPVVIPVLSYADDRDLRETVYRAYNRRASELADEGRYDNAAIIRETVALRFELAKLLGFADYAAYSVDNKMAPDSAAVIAFLEDLVAKGKAAGEADMAALRDYAARELNLPELAPWDIAYAAEKQRQALYALSQEDLRPYFPISQVLQGLFTICERLFGVRFRENPALATWHADARGYDMIDADGQLRARFYLDPYARAKKRGGAWMDSAVSRFADGDALQLPVAYLVCNFTPPVGDKEARLSHDEIITLFHETGHGLHHLLTQVDEVGVSGINGVEWDAVELPSQFMENFVWEYDVLAQMSSHEETGAVLPKELFDKMHAAKNFQRGMFLVRQMEFALFDMEIYHQEDEGRLKEWPQILDKVRQEVAVTQPPAYNRFALSFSHIFAGGYSAGYYSYAWAEVLSADAYAAFEESDDVAETGRRFWKEILAVGGSRNAAESFKAFRGREPSLDALLRHSGFDNAA